MRLFELPPALSALVLSSTLVNGFYLPGISPTTYTGDELVPLNVNRLTSAAPGLSNFPLDYYDTGLHFCEPEGGPRDVSESLGSILFGDRIQSSPYELRMGRNETCKVACSVTITDTGEPGEFTDADYINLRIKEQYQIYWLIDGLPAAQPYEVGLTGEVLYLPGFALGYYDNPDYEGGSFVPHEDGPSIPFLNNHHSLLIDYHVVDQNQYRVVGAQVKPSSYGQSKRIGTGNDFTGDCGDPTVRLQLLGGEVNQVTWTYDVYWRESETHFATRWDKYLHVFDPKIHWVALINSAVIFVFLVGIVSTILSRTLKKDIARYNRLDQLGLDDLNGTSLEEDGVQEDSGWKLIHGDVFRPPRNSLALSVLIGNGAQLFMMTGFTIAFAVVGFLSPSNRGSLGTVMILLYTFFSFIGGYAGARVYKSFRGTKWKQLFIYTPLAVPLIVFSTFFFLNFFLWIRQSSGAVPFTTMLVIVGMWFIISAPLSIIGSWIGFKQTIADPPVRTNQIPRQIPPAMGSMRTLPSMLAVGVLPFGAIFIELYFIMKSLWTSRIYYMFGFLFLSFGLLIVTSAAVTIMAVYFLLCAENYHWQWRAFASSGASAFYVFGYCLIYWVQMLRYSSFTGGLLYLGYSTLISFLWFVMTGTIGFFASWMFVHRIYKSLKID